MPMSLLHQHLFLGGVTKRASFFFLPAGYLLYEFTQFWQAEEPRDIMEFSRVREKFRKKVKQALKETDVRLLPKFQETLDS